MNAKFITPAITVMNQNGELDFEGQGKLYDHLISGNIDGILILGSIGEFFALTMEQKKELIKFAANYIDNRTRLIVGTTSMVFSEIVELSEFAYEQGANDVIIIPPYYFWLTDSCIEEYYDRLASEISGRIMMYNFPDRTGYSISAQSVLNLRRRHPNIIGIKDTLAGVDHTREIVKLVKGEFPDFEIFSGFDDNFARNVLSGGDGCIGGLSNVFPELFHDWTLAFKNDDLNKVTEIQQKVDRLMNIYSVGSPFIPYIKAAVRLRLGDISAEASFPFPKVTEEERDRLVNIMSNNGISLSNTIYIK